MKYRIINKNGIEFYHVIAEPGFVLKRISDEKIFGNEMELGNAYYTFKNGKPIALKKPIKELPEHYTEIEEIIIEDDYDNLV